MCWFSLGDCKECSDHNIVLETAAVLQDTESAGTAEPLRERSAEEVAARLAQQNQDEKDIITCEFSATHTQY